MSAKQCSLYCHGTTVSDTVVALPQESYRFDPRWSRHSNFLLHFKDLRIDSFSPAIDVKWLFVSLCGPVTVR